MRPGEFRRPTGSRRPQPVIRSWTVKIVASVKDPAVIERILRSFKRRESASSTGDAPRAPPPVNLPPHRLRRSLRQHGGCAVSGIGTTPFICAFSTPRLSPRSGQKHSAVCNRLRGKSSVYMIKRCTITSDSRFLRYLCTFDRVFVLTIRREAAV